jgi:hypothetical protein
VTFLSAGLGRCFPGMCNGDSVPFSSLCFDSNLTFLIKAVDTPVYLAALSVAQVKGNVSCFHLASSSHSFTMLAITS